MTFSMQNVVFTWDKETAPFLAFDEFSIKQGEKLLIRGPSGSGKSTILNLVAGLLLPEEGNVSMLGTELNTLSSSKRDHFRSDHMGFIFQNFNLVPYLNVLENVLLPLQFSKHKRSKIKNEKQEALRLLSALGLDNLSGQSVSTLSMGQQQRVAVARALMGSPELIIADEPSSALDADARGAFLGLLFQECERSKASLLYVSHDPGLEAFFDRTLPISYFSSNIGEASTCCPH